MERVKNAHSSPLAPGGFTELVDLAVVVEKALAQAEGLDARYIFVSEHDSVVTLAGWVTTYGDKIWAAELALKTAGVHGVCSELTVLL